MAELTADFESGVNGNTITTGDPGSATAWDFVNIGAGGNEIYDNAHTAFGMLAGESLAGSSNTQFGWTTALGTVTDHYGRLYAYISSSVNPSSNAFIHVTSTGSRRARIDFILVSGTIRIRIIDSPATGDITGSVAVDRDKWIRVEWHVIHSATVGQIEARLFNDHLSTVASEIVVSPATWNTGTNANTIAFGSTAGAGISNFNLWFDNIVANAASYPGPVSVVPISPPPLRLGKGSGG